MIVVSSCLLGNPCKYNGKDNRNEAVIKWCEGKEVLVVCPEQLGGLTTPRAPSEIQQSKTDETTLKIKSVNGSDVTNAFVAGAHAVLDMIDGKTIDLAIMKANSPSCGKGLIYDGTFSGTLISGNGITVQCLLDKGIKVITEKELNEYL